MQKECRVSHLFRVCIHSAVLWQGSHGDVTTQMRKHMKVARCTSVRAMGELPEALRGPRRLRHSADTSNFLDFDASDIVRDYREISYGNFEDNLPSISPSEMPSQVCKIILFGLFLSRVYDISQHTRMGY
jgi:hypothetical protein